jgi:phosphopantetheinyl transferase
LEIIWVHKPTEHIQSTLIGLARLTHTLSTAGLPASDLQYVESIEHPVRRSEAIGVRLLLRYLLEEHWHMPYTGTLRRGKQPLLNGYPSVGVSFSHAYPYVAVALSAHFREVGIDIERPRPQLLRVAPRIFAEQEMLWAGNDLEKLGILWAAKEALFKAYGEGRLTYCTELLVEPAPQDDFLIGWVLKQKSPLLSFELRVHRLPDALLCVWTNQRLNPR